MTVVTRKPADAALLNAPAAFVELPARNGLRFEGPRMRCRLLLPESASSLTSVLAFSHHKAGSVMLFRILEALATAVGIRYLSVPGDLFRRGVDFKALEIETEWPRTGFCFGGFRSYPEIPFPLIDTAPAILLVRDPRDAVVSHYFSVRDSHRLPRPDGALRRRMLSRRENAKAVSIDEWVIENHGAAIESLSSYVAQGFLSRPNVAIYRYEDVIYRKRAWIDDMLSWYGWQLADDVIEAIVRRFDVFPDRAAASKHIRQVHPGNHRALLKPETRAKLDNCFGHFLRLFGYADDEAG